MSHKDKSKQPSGVVLPEPEIASEINRLIGLWDAKVAWSGQCMEELLDHAARAATLIARLNSSPVSAGGVLTSSECACGDQYPANSYGAGFMAANNGVCENCDASAPSHGEQVRHMVPAWMASARAFVDRLHLAGWRDHADAQHAGAAGMYDELIARLNQPASGGEPFKCDHAACVSLGEHHPFCEYVKQSIGGDDAERAAFEAFVQREWPGTSIRRRDALPADHERYGEYVNAFVAHAWDSWQARAALSAPSHGERVPELSSFVAFADALGLDLRQSDDQWNSALTLYEKLIAAYPQARAALSAPNHSDQVRNMVPDGWNVERGCSPSGYVLHSPGGSMIRVCDSGMGGIETAFAMFLKALLAAAPSACSHKERGHD